MTAPRELPNQEPRVETGPTRFGDDWAGVFIRGDNAFRYAMALRHVLEADDEISPFMQAAVRDLLRLLESSDERTLAAAEDAE